ncbi:MAG TPA: hypothetical protein PKY40_04845, partial [Burkholderiaceae bacterium]|nr:hypothetical protein [Burkholderiaceae bacterium]
MAKLTFDVARLLTTLPSEKTEKLTLVRLAAVVGLAEAGTVTAVTPAPCTTVNADDELLAVSFAGTAAAAL